MDVADIHAAHARFGCKFDKFRIQFGNLFASHTESVFRKHDDAAPFCGFVRNGRELRRRGEIAFARIADGDKFARPAVAQSDGARFIQ